MSDNKYICISMLANGRWYVESTGEVLPGPTYNEEVTVVSAFVTVDDVEYHLKEYKSYSEHEGFPARYFAPVISDSELVLEEIDELINV